MRWLKRSLWISAWGVWAWLGVGLYRQLPREPGPAACTSFGSVTLERHPRRREDGSAVRVVFDERQRLAHWRRRGLCRDGLHLSDWRRLKGNDLTLSSQREKSSSPDEESARNGRCKGEGNAGIVVVKRGRRFLLTPLRSIDARQTGLSD
jgi:hypothetical protein